MGRKKFDYDLIVLGGGPAGYTAAIVAAKAKLKVAVVNNSFNKTSMSRETEVATALDFVSHYNTARIATKLGLSTASLRYNYPTNLRWRESTKRRLINSKKQLETAGVEVIVSSGNFVGEHEIAIGEQRIITGAKIIVATGASLDTGGIAGTEEVECLDVNAALKLERLPKVVFVIGAGRRGCEATEYFASLGAKVLIADIAGRLLPKEDEEVGQVLDYRFSKKGVKVLTQSRVIAVTEDKMSKKVMFLRGGIEKSVRVDAVILATGLQPNTDIGLENAGVRFDLNGIKTDKHLQTNVRHIFAAGDVLKRQDLAKKQSSIELANYEGALAATNAQLKKKIEVDYTGFIRTTNTEPTIATVGLTEDDCIKRDRKYKKVVVPLTVTNRAKLDDFYDGFVKIVANSQGKILGATIMAPGADILIQEIALAVKYGISVAEIASTPHVALGWADILRVAAQKLS